MPFLLQQFPYKMQLEIIEKLPLNIQLRMRRTCSTINLVIEKGSRALASQVERGAEAHITYKHTNCVMLIWWGQKIIHVFPLVMTPGFEKKLAGIPFKNVSVSYKNDDDNKFDVRAVYPLLEAWKPQCKTLWFINPPVRLNFLRKCKYFWVQKLLIISTFASEILENTTDFSEIRFPGNLGIRVVDHFSGNELFSKIKNFYSFEAYTDVASLTNIILEMCKCTGNYNIREASLFLKNDPPFQGLCTIAHTDFHIETYWKIEKSNALIYDIFAASILNLDSGNIALIKEIRRNFEGTNVIIRICTKDPVDLLQNIVEFFCLKEVVQKEESDKFLCGDDELQRFIIQDVLRRRYAMEVQKERQPVKTLIAFFESLR